MGLHALKSEICGVPENENVIVNVNAWSVRSDGLIFDGDGDRCFDPCAVNGCGTLIWSRIGRVVVWYVLDRDLDLFPFDLFS